MKITKRQLKRIIKEEKRKIISETNPDGTVSAGEKGERDDLIMHVEMQINELLDHVISESERIGGRFRGPGIKQLAIALMSDIIGSYKKR